MKTLQIISNDSAGPVSRYFGFMTIMRSGLTLVELLVVITIIGIVVAASVPMMKPMIESDKVKNGADIVSTYLAQARQRAISEGRPVGVRFERYTTIKDGNTYPYNGASVLMRQVAEPRPYSGFIEGMRVAADASQTIPNDAIIDGQPFAQGKLFFYAWDPDTNKFKPNSTEAQFWSKTIQTGDLVQFDGKGPKYKISQDPLDKKLFFIDMQNDEYNKALPVPQLYSYNVSISRFEAQPVTFKVFKQPQGNKSAPTMAAPSELPEGIVVDLDCSGLGRNVYDAETLICKAARTDGLFVSSDNIAIRDDFCAKDDKDRTSVTIMFAPSGEVSKVYYNDKSTHDPMNPLVTIEDKGSAGVVPSSPIFLCVGTWERAGFWEGGKVSDAYLPDSNVPYRNCDDMQNYWVTIFPKNGAIRVNRLSKNTPGVRSFKSIENSRTFAKSLHSTEVK